MSLIDELFLLIATEHAYLLARSINSGNVPLHGPGLLEVDALAEQIVAEMWGLA